MNSLNEQMQQLEDDARRYRWIRDNIKQRLTDGSCRGMDSLEHKTQYELPKLIAWADFCGEISLDDAIDIVMGCYKAGDDE